MADVKSALQSETDALILQITRLTAFHDRVRGVMTEASAAIAILDTFGATYTDLLAEIKPLMHSAGHAHHAIVECEERAVEFDGVLEQLMEVFGTGQDATCPAGSAQSAAPAGSALCAPLIVASQELRRKPLPLATAVLAKLGLIPAIAHAITSCPADLNTCLSQALDTHDMLGLALLLKDGRVDFEKHGLRILVAVIQSGHMDILVQLTKQKGVFYDTAKAAKILLIEDKGLRQAAFEVIMRRWIKEGTESRIELIVALLACTSLVGPGACSDELLEHFVRTQNTSAVRTLLADAPRALPERHALPERPESHARFEPSVESIMFVIEMANKYSSAELKHLLVNYAGAHPAVDVDAVLYAAIACQDLGSIRALLKNPRINHFYVFRFFIQAIQTGSVDVVALFLKYSNVYPADHGNDALELARDMKNKALVDLLLADERVQKRNRVFKTSFL